VKNEKPAVANIHRDTPALPYVKESATILRLLQFFPFALRDEHFATPSSG
jgi:hypothetical protein